MPHRLPDWPARLSAFFKENRSRKFQYGEWDCCLMAAAAIEAMTGVHPDPSCVGAYSNRGQCNCLIKRRTGKFGAQHIWRQVMQQNGYEERPASFAQRGDPVLIKRTSSYSVGIVALDGDVIVAASKGLVKIPRDRAVSSWQI